jgi:uncharacterized protein DUF4375
MAGYGISQHDRASGGFRARAYAAVVLGSLHNKALEAARHRPALHPLGSGNRVVSTPESYLIRLSKRIVPLTWDSPSELTAAERHFACVWQLEAEVNNGGFHQYYFNSAGDFALDTAEALDAIGAPHTAQIVRDANSVFPDGPPRDRDARQSALAAISEDAFAEYDDAFLAYEDDLSSLLFAYVQANRTSIRGA